MKTKKRSKSSRMSGQNMGTHGRGARCKARGTGHRGGKGMSGSGKRGDQKKTLITKLYGGNYFGKQGMTSKGTKKDKTDKINVGEIQGKYKSGEVNLKNYKILGTGEVKEKFIITANSASKSAIEKVKGAGGEIILVKTNHTPKEKESKKGKISEKSKKDSKAKK